MLKKVLVVAVIFLIASQGAALAADTRGEIIARDATYGAGIGLFLGLSIWLIDAKSDTVLPAMGIGLTVGTLVGIAYGVSVDTQSFVSIENGGVKWAVPAPAIEKTADDWRVKTSLLKVGF